MEPRVKGHKPSVSSSAPVGTAALRGFGSAATNSPHCPGIKNSLWGLSTCLEWGWGLTHVAVNPHTHPGR